MDDPALITAWATAAIAVVTGGGAAAACFLVWRGILEMRRSSDRRAKDREETRAAGLRRHDEAMAALRALIERTAPAPAGRPGEAG